MIFENGKIRCWSVQRASHWDASEHLDKFKNSKLHRELMDSFQLEWMERMMTKKISPAPDEWHSIIWAWVQFNGKPIQQPPYDELIIGVQSGSFVMVEFDIPFDFALLSDNNLWCTALGGDYIGRTDSEDEIVWAEMLKDGLDKISLRSYPDEWLKRVKKTWEWMFDLEASREINKDSEQQCIQASMWFIDKSWVRNVVRFDWG